MYLPSCNICDTTCESINTIDSVHIAKKVKLTTIYRTNIKLISTENKDKTLLKREGVYDINNTSTIIRA